MQIKELKKKVQSWIPGNQADQIVQQYNKLTYPELRERYDNFINTGRLWDTIDKDDVMSQDLIDLLENVGKNEARRMFISHALVFDILFEEEEKKTAVDFYSAINTGNRRVIENIIEKHDKKGNYRKLFKIYEGDPCYV